MLTLLILIVSASTSLVNGQTPPKIAVHPDRIQLFKDALGWMTFRKNGQLMTNTEYESLFLETLLEKYRSSKFYRTFVIAFQQGVIPKLTLNLNDPCDPDYTLKYKDPFNSSVTFAYQKKFTFDTYDNKGKRYQFCDYRQGLVCDPIKKSCQCPYTALMEPIDTGSSTKRCLLQKNDICNFIDIDHGGDPQQPTLKNNLYHLIFNLEKPISCKPGTQCRFKSSNIVTPLCYDTGPFAPPYVDSTGTILDGWILNFGRECTLGLYADPGSCEVPHSFGTDAIPGYQCFNFGPPRSMKSSNPTQRTGFCAHEWGPFGVINSYSSLGHQARIEPLISLYVHPRTVPLQGGDLEDYMKKYYKSLTTFSSVSRKQVTSPGKSCSVKQTAKWEEIWTYFSGLEADPPPGKDFVVEATKSELDTKLQEFINLGSTGNPCKVYLNYGRPGVGKRIQSNPSLKCVATGSPPDSNQNDGKCEAPGNLKTDDYADRLIDYLDSVSLIHLEESKEKDGYRRDILNENPELQCSPALNNARRKRLIDQADTLEGGHCPDGFVCYEDYSDNSGIYDSSCRLRKSPPQLSYACHEDRDRVTYGRCEGQQLEIEIQEEFERMVDYSKLGRGDDCQYKLEADIRQWIRDEQPNMNKYAMLATLKKEKSGKGNGLCDRTRLLDCDISFKCECVRNTEPRKVTIDGKEYLSDYCYFTKGVYTQAEKDEMKDHYGKGEYECLNGNVCVFVDTEMEKCTTENTGKTGHDLIGKPKPPPPEPESTTKKSLPGGNEAGGPGHRFAGSAGYIKGSLVVILSVLMISSSQIYIIY